MQVGYVRELWILKHSAFSHITKDSEQNKRPLHSVISALPASHTPALRLWLYISSNLKKKGKIKKFFLDTC